MSTVDFQAFNNYFLTLPNEYQTIVLHLIQNMEHIGIPPKEIRYRRGFNIALAEHDMSIMTLVHILEEKFSYQEHFLASSICSLIENGYKGMSSSYFDMVCEYLGIDEHFLIMNSEYMNIHIQDMKWCFETLSSMDQYAAYNLVIQLNGIDCIKEMPSTINKTISSCGISSIDIDENNYQ